MLISIKTINVSIILIILFCFPILSTAQSRSFDTTFICKNQTFIIEIKDLNNDFGILSSIVNSKDALYDTIDVVGLANIEFIDFNKDGYPDIVLSYFGNNTTYYLYLFDPKSHQYKFIEGYMNYPEAMQIRSSKEYYYSYHRAGCADLNWVSDLFKLVNFEILHLGRIYGQGCDFEIEGNPQSIEIFIIKDNGKNEELFLKLPYSKYIPSFDSKWDFIAEYWNENYTKFTE